MRRAAVLRNVDGIKWIQMRDEKYTRNKFKKIKG